MLVQKFGGSSVADAERMRNVADYVARAHRRGDQPVVVVSAMGHETDDLLDLAAKVSRTLPGREMDMLITAGERKAMALLCMALHDLGVPADSFTGSQAGIVTNGEHTKAKIVEMRPDRLSEPPCRPAASPWWAAPRESPSTARSRSWAGAAPTRRRWRWPRPWTPTPASCTPTSRAFSVPTPGSCRGRGG